MSFTGDYRCTSFKVEILRKLHDFTAGTGDSFKIALYDSNASFTAATTVYTTVNEVSGTGYTAGGGTLTNVTPTSGNEIGYASFDDYTFSTVTLTARGAMIYNSTEGNRAVMILDFGSNKTRTAADLKIEFPSADITSAIIRIA